MAQCENHNAFLAVVLDFGWLLWEYGTDTSCEHYPQLVPIWFRPCSWDDGQRQPLGCLCCTDLNQALKDWAQEKKAVHLTRTGRYEFPREESSVLAPPASFIPPYRPH